MADDPVAKAEESLKLQIAGRSAVVPTFEAMAGLGGARKSLKDGSGSKYSVGFGFSMAFERYAAGPRTDWLGSTPGPLRKPDRAAPRLAFAVRGRIVVLTRTSEQKPSPFSSRTWRARRGCSTAWARATARCCRSTSGY